MLSIIVCIKQVPDTQKGAFDPRTGTIDRGITECVMNPDDLHAIEMALFLKDTCGATITAVTMGPPRAEDVLGEAYALGVDRCVLVTDPCFAGSDSLITSKILSRAVSLIGRFDIIITGCEAIDGNTAHVGYQLSEFLGVPLITQIHKLQIDGRHAVIERLYGHEYQKIRVALPLLLAVSKKMNRVRIPRLADIKSGMDKSISVFSMKEIGGSEDEYGVSGSPTVVIETEIFSHKRGREVIAGSLNEKADLLIHKLKKHNILRY
jgi:electron transfer flavoprotein beta subunit